MVIYVFWKFLNSHKKDNRNCLRPWAHYLGKKFSYSVEELCLCTICSVWSKTTLITGGGAGANPPSCKTGTFFLMSLAIYRNFQSNGAKWPSLKL